MKAFIATSEALGYVSEAIHAIESSYKDGLLNDNACAAYLDMIDARYKLEKAIARSYTRGPLAAGELVTDADYNLRGF